MNTQRVPQVGDVMVCRSSQGYAFTEGKEYTLLDYQPVERPEWSNGFTWPAYVQVLDDRGRSVLCHAHRFIHKELT